MRCAEDDAFAAHFTDCPLAFIIESMRSVLLEMARFLDDEVGLIPEKRWDTMTVEFVELDERVTDLADPIARVLSQISRERSMGDPRRRDEAAA